MTKFLIGTLLLLLTGVVGLFGVIAIGMAEPQRMALNGWMTPLFVPAEVRKTPLVAVCGEAVVSRSLQECGGICGEVYRVRYSSTEAEANLRERILRYAADFPKYALTVGAGQTDRSSQCVPYTIEYYWDYSR